MKDDFENESGQCQPQSKDESELIKTNLEIDQVIHELELHEKPKKNGTELNSGVVQKYQITTNQSKSSEGQDLSNQWEEFSQAINTPKEKTIIDQATNFQTTE